MSTTVDQSTHSGRDEATEDLFNKDGTQDRQQPVDGREPGQVTGGNAGEELFRQNIQQGSRGQDRIYEAKADEAVSLQTEQELAIADDDTPAAPGEQVAPIQPLDTQYQRSDRTEAQGVADSVELAASHAAADRVRVQPVEAETSAAPEVSSDRAAPLSMPEVRQTQAAIVVPEPVAPDTAEQTEAVPQAEMPEHAGPSNIALSVLHIDEQSPAGSLVAKIAASGGSPGQVLTYSIVDDPNGLFEVIGDELRLRDGAVVDFEVADAHEVVLRATDQTGSSYTERFTIGVNDLNDAPVAGPDLESSVSEGADTITGRLTGTDQDHGAVLQFSVAAGATSPDGFTLNADGSWSFDPSDAAYDGLGVGDSQVLTIPVTVTDDQGATDTAQIQLTVTGTNDAPVAGADVTQSVAEGASTISGQLTATDADDGATATYSISDGSTAPDGFTLNADGSWSFDPSDAAYDSLAVGDSQVLTIPVTVTDDQGATDTAHIQLTVTGTNDAPVAGADVTQSVAEGASTISGQLTSTDADDGATATYSISDGSTAPDGFVLNADGSWSFDPSDAAYENLAVGDSAVLTIPVTVTDDQGATDTAQIQLTVTGTNDAPVAGADVTQSTDEDIALTLQAADLLGNDVDLEGDTLAITSVQNATHGSVVLNGDGSVTFTPDANYNGPASFSYSIVDGNGGTYSATVTLNVDAVNDSIGLVSDIDTDANTVAENAANGTVVGITASAIDIDGDDVTYSIVDADGNPLTDGPFSVDTDTGVVTVRDGSQLDFESQTSHEIFIKASSSDGTSSTNGFTVDIADVFENLAPVAVDDSADGTTYALPDGGRIVSDGNGVTVVTGEIVTAGDMASSIDQWTFHHNGGPLTIDTLSESGDSFVDIDADGVKDHTDIMMRLYDADGNQVAVNDDSNLGTDDGSTNDTQVHNQDSFIDLNDLPAGDYTLAIGSWDLSEREVSDDYNDNSDVGFDYDHSQDTGPYQITFTGDIAFNPYLTTDEDRALTIPVADLLGNDTDANGDMLTITSVQDAMHGSVVLNDDGTVTFTPDADFNGEASFSYSISDGNGGTDSATVTLNVDAVNDSIGLVSDSDANANSVAENAATGTQVGITASAIDIDGDAITYSIVDADGNPVADGPFAVDAHTGVVMVRDGGQLDYETQTAHQLHIEATSADGSSSTRTFSIDVADVFEDVTASAPTLSLTADDAVANTSVQVDMDAVTARGLTLGDDGQYYETVQQDVTLRTETAKIMKTEEISVGRADTIRMDDAPEYGAVEIQDADGNWQTMQVGQEYDADSAVRFTPDVDAIGDGTRDIRIGTFGENVGTGQFTAQASVSDWGELSPDGSSVVFTDGDLTVTTTSNSDDLYAYNSSGNSVGSGIGDSDRQGLSGNETLTISIEGESVNQVSFTLDGLGGYFDESSRQATRVNITAYDQHGNVIDVQSDYRDSGSYSDVYSFTTNVPVASFELGTSGGNGNYVVQNMTLSKTISDEVTFTATYAGGTEVTLTSNLNIEDADLSTSMDLAEMIPASDQDVTREVQVIDLDAMAAKGAFKVDGVWVVETSEIQDVLQLVDTPMTTVTDSFDYALHISAALTDTDGSETLSDVLLQGLPDSAVLLDADGNAMTPDEGGRFALSIDSGESLDVTLRSPTALDDAALDAINATVSSTESVSGDTAETVAVLVSSDADAGDSPAEISPFEYDFDTGAAAAAQGGSGGDELVGTAGSDYLAGEDGNDHLTGEAGDDLLDGGDKNDHLEGGEGDDVLLGQGGNDHLEGGAGGDYLSGGDGNDRLDGGDGSDVYHFDFLGGSDIFRGGEGGGWTDVIDLSDALASADDPENPWTITIDGEQVEYDLAAHALDLDPDTSGVVELSDGSEISFEGVEKIEW